MSDTSARYAMPLLAPGQAQKELFHNEALAIVDAVLHPVALTIGDASPPAAPAVGQCWIVGAAPVAAWSGHAQALAAWTEGGWRFVAPIDGLTVWVAARGLSARYAAGEWTVGDIAARRLIVDGRQVVGAQAAAIPAPAGGSTIDDAGRTAIAAIIAVLSGHGLIAN